MRVVGLIVMTLSLSGCVSVVPTDRPVQVLKSSRLMNEKHCTPVGNVSGFDPIFGSWDTPFNGVARMKNQAIGLGADHVLVTSSFSATGIAYRCADKTSD